MSYLVRDDNAILGPETSVELGNGAGAPTIARLQVYEPVGIFGANGSGGTGQLVVASTFYTVYLSPPLPSNTTAIAPLGGKHQVAGVSVWYHTATSGAATMFIESVPAGTADGGGNNILSASSYALNTALTANTPSNLALNANVNNLQLTNNSRLNVYFGSTATTGLVDLTVAIYLVRI